MNVYERAANDLLVESGCIVRRWRKSMTGVAFTKAKDWGIEAPQPRGPISFGVFAHEIGHQVLHRQNGSYPRWQEEIEAWEYALEQFERFDLLGKERSQADAAKALVYAAAKANRRCSPETAQAILERFPDWVWSTDSGCAMVAADLNGRGYDGYGFTGTMGLVATDLLETINGAVKNPRKGVAVVDAPKPEPPDPED